MFRYTAAKRFGLEGCETLIPGMKAMIDRITDLECKNIVIGMPHRGEGLLQCQDCVN
jgi:2-oxoglutarate dehydrogenase E1 component